MRTIKLAFCLLALLLPLGCSQGGGGGEQLAVELRGRYLASPMVTADVSLTADYGERVYDFSFQVVSTGDKTSLTLVAPVELQGMVVEIDGEDSTVSCDGVLVETGSLAQEGLTPITAIPTIFSALEAGFIERCALEDGVLTLCCRDPDVPVGTGQEVTLRLDEATGDLLGAEIFVDGVRKIDCTVEAISWG